MKEYNKQTNKGGAGGYQMLRPLYSKNGIETNTKSPRERKEEPHISYE